jgi:hypothetical protein
VSARSASIKRAVDAAVRASELTAREEATAALAKRLAAELDAARDPELVVKLAARLLPTLEALGMTRAAAAGAARGGTSDGAGSALDELKERRAALRQRDAAVVDAAPAGS